MARSRPAKAVAQPDDGVLYSDSEEDEFTSYKPGMAEDGEVSDLDEEAMGDSEDEDEDGVGVYEADEWDEGASASSSDEEQDEDEAQLVGLMFPR